MISNGKEFTEEEVLAIAYSILCAMNRITELKFIHRDIKVSHISTYDIYKHVNNLFTVLRSHLTF